MRAKKRAKRRERHRRFPPMVRIVGGELPAGLALGATGIYGVPTTAGETTFTLRIAGGPTDFRQAGPTLAWSVPVLNPPKD